MSLRALDNISGKKDAISVVMFIIISFVFLATVHLSTSKRQNVLPAAVTKEVYCLGCEYTVKALEKVLAVPSADFMDVRVVEAMESVCVKESFTGADFSSHLLVESCEHLLGQYSDIIEPLLIGHYVRHDRPSFLELVQQICMDLTKACPGISPHMNAQSADSHVFLEQGTNKFKVKPGVDMKIPNPVKETKEDL